MPSWRDADVLLENFRPGAMDKLGFGYEALSERNPRLVYCSLKGFLPGPYGGRVALDEVTQMMGGLAYMTGLPGKPMRAGSSIVDITGGMFGVDRHPLRAAGAQPHRPRPKRVTSALFETTAFLVGQHMAQQSVLGEEPQPMSVRRAAWGVYDLFDCADGQLFVAVVSDTQWRQFCADFGLQDLAADAALADNAGRVAERERFMPALRELFAGLGREAGGGQAGRRRPAVCGDQQAFRPVQRPPSWPSAGWWTCVSPTVRGPGAKAQSAQVAGGHGRAPVRAAPPPAPHWRAFPGGAAGHRPQRGRHRGVDR